VEIRTVEDFNIPRVIPNPCASEQQHRRWYHHDLEGDALDPRQLWAERHVVEHDLARRLWHRRRPRIVFVESDGRPVDDAEWLEQRARRLRAAEERQ
jgi:hypothetical protein